MVHYWRIGLLGWFRLEPAGAPGAADVPGSAGPYPAGVIHRFRTRQSASLLAYLAFYAGRPHPREALVELLWPECDPEAGRNRLRQTLHSLRCQLEPPGVPAGAVLQADRFAIQLNTALCSTDVAAFEAALLDARLGNTLADEAQRLAHAVDQYTGELLPGFYEDWVLTERERLAEAASSVLERLVDRLDRLGEPRRARAYARRALILNPLGEEWRSRVAAPVDSSARQGQGVAPALGLDTKPTRRSRGAAAGPCGRRAPARHRPDVGSRRPDAVLRSTVLHSVPGPAPRPRLPLRLSRFFGREEDLSRLVAWLAPAAGQDVGWRDTHPPHVSPDQLTTLPSRLITLTGAGGAGKTRLALEAAERIHDRLGWAVWFVPLAEVRHPERILPLTVEAVGLPPLPAGQSGPDVLERLETAMAGTGPTGFRPALLVLDNFEQLLFEQPPGGAEPNACDGSSVILQLLERVPQLRCVVTSRRRLNLEGERELPVPPLPVPEPSNDPLELLRNPSAQLFVDRAQAVRPDFQVTPGNAAAIAQLCSHLEGIPLALELAAPRVQALSPRQILARLGPDGERRLDFLRSRERGGSPEAQRRHGTLRTTVDWSFRLLPQELRRCFAALSIFRGGWTLEAAEAIWQGEGSETIGQPGAENGEHRPCPNPQSPVSNLPTALDALEQLRECSLVLAEEVQFPVPESAPHQPAGPAEAGAPNREPVSELRYRMLETLREFAADQRAPEEHAQLSRRHALHFLALAEAAEGQLVGAAAAEWQARLGADQENLLAALEWSLAAASRPPAEVEVTSPDAAAAPAEIALRLAGALGRYWLWRGQWADGRAALERALALHRRASPPGETPGGDPEAVPHPVAHLKALQWIRWLAYRQGDLDHAQALMEESLRLERAWGTPAGAAGAIHDLAVLAHARGELDRAASLANQELDLLRAAGDQGRVPLALGLLGRVAMERGDYTAACGWLEQALAVAREGRATATIAETLHYLGAARRYAGRTLEARQALEEGLALNRSIGYTTRVGQVLHHLGRLALAEGRLDEAGAHYREALETGRQSGDRWNIGGCLTGLADVAGARGDTGEALRLCRESLAVRTELGDRRGVADSLEQLAAYLAASQPPAPAGAPRAMAIGVRTLAAAGKLRADLGAAPSPTKRTTRDQCLCALRAALGEARFLQAWEAGLALSWEQAVAEALGGED